MHLLLVCIFCVLVCGKAKDQLVAVNLMYRHGERAPLSFYPTDPYQDPSIWPVPLGELTNIGKNQEYALGKWLRQHYGSFLSPKYSAKELFIQSSDYDRCLMSAAANLAGLYPPQDDQVWNPDLLWQPIPIHTRPDYMDGMLASKKPCPNFEKLAYDLLKTQQYRDYENGNKQLYAYLSDKTGMKIDSFFAANDLYDTLLIEDLDNYTLPDWTKSVYPDKLLPVALASYEFQTYTSEMAKFRVGQVFDQVLKQFESFVSSSSSVPKFQILSAHDNNVFNVLNSLHIPNLGLVPYVGMVVFELRQNNEGKYYVRFLYKQSAEPEVLTIEGCTPECSFDTFRSILKPLSLSELEWDDACKLKNSKK